MNTYELLGPEVPGTNTMYPLGSWASNTSISPALRRLLIAAGAVVPPKPTAKPRTPATRQVPAGRMVDISDMPQSMRIKIENIRLKTSSGKAEVPAQEVNLYVPPKRPAESAGIRAWEAYYRAVGFSPPSPSQRRKLEKREKDEFARATGRNYFIPRSFTQTSGLGVKRGVTWMFATAYDGDMPYWDEWIDNPTKSTGERIAKKVAADYKREILRRVAIQAKHRTEREAWYDAGRPGPRPTIDPDEGIYSPIAPARTYAAETKAAAPPPELTPARKAPGRPEYLPLPALKAPEARKAPGRPEYLPLPPMGPPGALGITRTTMLNPRTGRSRVLVGAGGQSFSFPAGRPRADSRWLRFQAGPGGFVQAAVGVRRSERPQPSAQATPEPRRIPPSITTPEPRRIPPSITAPLPGMSERLVEARTRLGLKGYGG